jgi:hypothetical protein
VENMLIFLGMIITQTNSCQIFDVQKTEMPLLCVDVANNILPKKPLKWRNDFVCAERPNGVAVLGFYGSKWNIPGCPQLRIVFFSDIQTKNRFAKSRTTMYE